MWPISANRQGRPVDTTSIVGPGDQIPLAYLWRVFESHYVMGRLGNSTREENQMKKLQGTGILSVNRREFLELGLVSSLLPSMSVRGSEAQAKTAGSGPTWMDEQPLVTIADLADAPLRSSDGGIPALAGSRLGVWLHRKGGPGDEGYQVSRPSSPPSFRDMASL